jgi:Baseplate J-like protein
VAAKATARTTWTVRDDAGYRIYADTTVAYRQQGNVLVGFQVLADIVVPPGAVQAIGTVMAVEAGTAQNGLGAPGAALEPQDPLDYVTAVTLNAATSGGADDEDEIDYVNRLASKLSILADRPILAPDFAILARDISGVWRAVAIDNFIPGSGNPGDSEKAVAVYPIDASGNDVDAATQAAVDDYLQSLRELNFIVTVISPTRTIIDVTYIVLALANFDTVAVKAAIDSAIMTYLSPANWGLPPTSTSGQEWQNKTTVFFWELIALINDVAGVDRVQSLTIRIQGGVMGTTDVPLPGVVPLPQPGVIAGTVNAGG